MEEALCRNHPELTTADFFPTAGGKRFGMKGDLIRETCAACPVGRNGTGQCSQYAQDWKAVGIWDGVLRQSAFRPETNCPETERVNLKS